MKLTNAQVIALIVVAGVLVVGIVASLAFTSAAAHEDSDVFVTRLTTLVGVGTGAVASLVALFRTKTIQNNQESVAADLAVVKSQTNGPITRMASQVSDVHDATVTPTTPTGGGSA